MVGYLGVRPAPAFPLPGVHVLRGGDEVELTLSFSPPAAEHWLQVLAGSELNWWHAFLQSELCKAHLISPILCWTLVPRAGQKIVIHLLDDQPNHISIYGDARLFGVHQPDVFPVDIRFDVSSHLIDPTLFEERQCTAVPLFLQFSYEPSQPYAPIYEIAEGPTSGSNNFTGNYGSAMTKNSWSSVRETFTGSEVTIFASEVDAFCAVVGNQQEKFKTVRTDEVKAPSSLAGKQ